MPRRALRLVVLALVAGACCTSCRNAAEPAEEPPPAVAVHCVPAKRSSLPRSLTLRGRVATPPGGDVPVASVIPGWVIETKVKEGQHVAKGAVVALVDDLAPRAQAKQADAAVARAKANDSQATTALARTRALAADGLASKADVEDAAAKADAARAELEAAQAATKLAAGTLGRVEVRSQFDGIVTRVWRGAGALVDGTAATPILELAAVGAVELVADATDRELSRVREGQRAEIQLGAGARYAGSVLARAAVLEPATGLGLVRILVGAGLDDASAPQAGAKPMGPLLGAFGEARIDLGSQEDALVVPRNALRGAIADGAEVAVCKGDTIELRTIEVGWRDGARVEVTGGLAEGEDVAVGHVLGLETGSKITRGAGAPDTDAGDRP